MKLVALALVCLVGLLAVAQASEFDHETVENLGEDFDQKVRSLQAASANLGGEYVIHPIPTIRELADAYEHDDDVSISHVDCTVQRDTCAKQEIRGYPTIKLFHKGEATQYQGARDFKSFKKFIDEHKAKLLK